MNKCDRTIVSMRKEGAKILTLREHLSTYVDEGMLDEAIQLAHVLRVLDEHHLTVTRKEVRAAFNEVYQKKYHGDKKSYLAWFYKMFNVQKDLEDVRLQARCCRDGSL